MKEQERKRGLKLFEDLTHVIENVPGYILDQIIDLFGLQICQGCGKRYLEADGDDWLCIDCNNEQYRNAEDTFYAEGSEE